MSTPRILIVDDSPVVLRALSAHLAELGLQITTARDGNEGKQLAFHESFDLIITDIDMPGMDGFALCSSLKENAETRGIPVVILSSYDNEENINRGFQMGATAFISKTEGSEYIEESIAEIIRQSTFQRQRRILVVDDSATIRRIVKKALQEAGFQVETAIHGREALAMISAGALPDLILSDIDMPEMNGIDFCEAVHADPQLATIPFMIMSANSERSIVRRMLHRGANAYLVKPFNLEQLVVTVEKMLSDQYLLLLKDRERLDAERRLMLASITSLITALEARDEYTRGHSEAVALILSGMAMQLGLTSEEHETLEIAGRLHDLGKIGIPDHILLKPGKLTEEEFESIRRHPIVGAGILESIPTLSQIIPVILHHHERFDGTGYPDRLKREEIPLWARMTAVADTFDALTSDRPYRQGMPVEIALQIITEVRGTQLCPECVDVFLAWMRSEGRLQGPYRGKQG